MTLRIAGRRHRSRFSWTGAVLALVMLLPGVGMLVAALGDRPEDLAGLGVQGWMGIVALPLALGVLVPVALAGVTPRGPRQRWIWRWVEGLLIVGVLSGVLALAGGHLFMAANRNGLMLGTFLLGGGLGVVLALLWQGSNGDVAIEGDEDEE